MHELLYRSEDKQARIRVPQSPVITQVQKQDPKSNRYDSISNNGYGRKMPYPIKAQTSKNRRPTLPKGNFI